MIGSLFIIATPIGNLKDISIRAVEMIDNLDFIICEDTRITAKLLNKYSINKKMISFNEHNENKKSDLVVNKLLDGLTGGLLCDAGTPCISDPGYRLLSKLRLEHPGISVVPLPGPSACISALSISGLPTDSFYFVGFLPKKKGRQKKIKELCDVKSTVVIYESPFRINKTLLDLYTHFGDRKVFIAREMTKLHEEYIYTSLFDIVSTKKKFKEKGEYVIIVARAEYEV